ncbi:MAG: hypothetical protein LV468_02370, partial [Candidatus Nitrosotenuis sp.]|nr:hypothetical protein [Candidatus Nitrosotenuis sp.]
LVLISNTDYKTLTRDSKLFVQKTARSIVQIQHGVNNLADIVVFLEVLGYNKELIERYGFESLYVLAQHVYDFIDFYYDDEQDRQALQSRETPIPTQRQRLAEGLGMIFPWLGSLLLLFLTGVSLWMALFLPKEITTLFVGGVFLGLLLTEGPLQAFNRLFTFHHEQGNLGEVKRIIRRCYMTVSAILLAASVVALTVAALFDVPYHMIGVLIVSMITVSLHRASYMVIFALKKIKHLIIAYSGAFATITTVYLFGNTVIPSHSTRYFVSLVLAFAVLSVFSVFHHRSMMVKKSLDDLENVPHFYNPGTVTDRTISSRFSVQMWEMLPHYLFGTIYFVMLFADRVISWMYNPDIAAGGSILIEFNTAYHTGVDMGLLVMLSAAMIQYVMMAPIHIRINNLILNLKIGDAAKIDDFIREQHRRLVRYSLLASVATAVTLAFFAPQIAAQMGGTEKTIMLLRFASISNVFIALFVANNMFLFFLNKTKHVIYIVAASSAIVIIGGVALGESGFENIIIAYMASAVFAFVVSSIYVRKIIKNAGSIFFSRYV